MDRVKLSVEVEPELRRRVKIAAARKDQSVREWIAGAVERELEHEAREGAGEVSRASAPAFGRDWGSEEDSVYDELGGSRETATG